MIQVLKIRTADADWGPGASILLRVLGGEPESLSDVGLVFEDPDGRDGV